MQAAMKTLNTTKMVATFRRSLSFPNPKSSKPRRHLRSISLPTRLHSQLQDDLHRLLAWQHTTLHSLPSIADGLSLIDHLLSSLSHILPHQAPTDRLLDDLLRLVDAHGTFRSALLSLRHHHSATRAALRRRDAALLASCIRSQRRAEREVAHLAAAVKGVASAPAPAEADRLLRDVMSATAAASAAVFSGVAAASEAELVTAARWSRCGVVGSLLGRRCGNEEEEAEDEEQRRRALKKMEAAEESLVAVEEKSDRIFRSLVNARVALLNIMTDSL